MPKAKRQYDAVELGISRRFANNWFGSANLTISRLYGNYAGLASSDEIRTPTTGVSSATAQQQARLDLPSGRQRRTARGTSTKRCSTPTAISTCSAVWRPIVRSSSSSTARTTSSGNTQIGVFFYAGSGTPMTTYVNTVNQTEVFVEGRGDMGRTPFYSKTDLLVSHELPMAGNKRLRFELNVLNLFNQKTARHIFNYLNRGARRAAGVVGDRPGEHRPVQRLRLQRDDPRDTGWRERIDPRYGMDDLFEPGTQGQFSVKFLF